MASISWFIGVTLVQPVESRLVLPSSDEAHGISVRVLKSRFLGVSNPEAGVLHAQGARAS